jgi:cytochrome P450
MSVAAERRLAPGPKGEPILGSARGFQRDLLQTLLDGWREHGDIVRFKGVGPLFPVHLPVHPDYVTYVLKDNAANYPKTPFINDRWRMVVGNGLICSEGAFWLRQRRLAQPSFDPKLLRSFDGGVADRAQDLADDWERHAETGRPVEVAGAMVRLALAVLGQAMFSTDWRRDAEAMAPAVHVTIGHAYHQIESFVPIPLGVPTPRNRRFLEARAVLDEIMYRLIRERRQMDDGPQDLLGTLMHAQDPDTGERMSDEQIHDELMTFMFGGHETVASGMAWTLYLLSKHPEVQRRMRAEIDGVLQGERPTADAMTGQLPYTTRVINESLRLYPPVSLISRSPLADDEIGGYHVPKGGMVLICSYVSHRHSGIWDNPEGFDPDRWLPERSEGRPKNAWFPFSGGPRQCIGGYFGLIEMHIVLSMILQRFELDLVPGHPVEPRPGITLGFRNGLQMTVRHRTEPTASREQAQKAAAPA